MQELPELREPLVSTIPTSSSMHGFGRQPSMSNLASMSTLGMTMADYDLSDCGAPEC